MAIQITTTSLPNGFVGVAYSQTVQQTGGQAPIVWTKPSGSLPTSTSLNASTGAITGTPTVAGLYTFTILATDNNAITDSQAFEVRIYAALNTSPDPVGPATSVIAEVDDQIQFTSTGGSGNYVWSVTGGNLINPFTGLMTAVNGGNWVVTLVDQESGQVQTISIIVTAQSQFCVTGEATEEAVTASDVCCEFNVECGDKLQLRVPSFHIKENGDKKSVVYGNIVQATTGEAAKLQSTSTVGGATGNEVSFNRDAYYEIVTTEDMADPNNGEFGIGWSTYDADQSVSSIEHAVVWFTDGSDRMVEIRHGGDIEAASQFDIAEGDAVSFGVINGEGQLWINSVKVFTSGEDFVSCGTVMLDIGIEEQGKFIGGYVQNLAWEIITTGTAAEVGTIDADGVYTSPSTPLAGVIEVSGAVGTAKFFVDIRNIQPTPKFTKPQPFLAGRRAHVWVTNRKAGDNDIIRIASDGSPDALQNPGMIYLGVLEASAKFAEDNQTQDFVNDVGIYQTVVTEERATLVGTFLEVRDFDKLAILMQHATLYSTTKGVREIGVGGKTCGGCDLRAVLVVEAGTCGSGWDVIYLPRVQNTANLVIEVGTKTNAKYELNFRVLPDVTRQAGRQLWSMYQMENCTDIDSAVSCE